MSTADYVIVGAGAAGCVLADRLSADGKSHVVLLEAGGADPNGIPEVRVPIMFPRKFGSEIDWGYTTTPQAGLNGRSIPFPRGRVLGGSTSINAQLWTIGHRADYDEWAASGLAGWGYADVLPYFEKIEAERVKLAGLRYPSPVTADFLSACARVGHVPAGALQEGYMLARATHVDGVRWSNADAYLGTARERSNLDIQADTLVRRVLLEGTRAVGVEVETAGGVTEIRANREVILAAGAVGSPHLLMLSGIGPATHLADHGVPVRVDLPGVGRGLADHLLVPLAFTANGFTSPGADAGDAEIQRYLADRTGPLESIFSEALVFLRTRAELAAPDIEVVLLLAPFGEHETEAAHGLSLGVVLLRPESRGSVTLRTADPHDAPAIDLGMLSDPAGADLATAVAGVRKAQEILNEPGFAKWWDKPLTSGALSDRSEDITEYIRQIGGNIHHPVSTCRMGVDPESVVDERFRVRGTSGLRVTDAAAMPSLVRAHTHAPVTMLAERAAEMVLAGD